MPPEMSKIAIYFFVPILCSHKTQALEFYNKRRYYSFASKQILYCMADKRKDILAFGELLLM